MLSKKLDSFIVGDGLNLVNGAQRVVWKLKIVT